MPASGDEQAAQPRSRNRFFAFSAVGVAMVCVPLAQVLQYQNNDLQQLRSERALLDPVSQAVTTQHSLLTHRDLAGQVLVGRSQFEGERQLAQGDVHTQMASLAGVLTGGAWTFALAEARTLAEDWASLAADVEQRRISAPQSFDAHALRLEQTLQTVDNVTVYNFMYPIDSLHPAATNKQKAIWCAKDRMAAWQDAVLRQKYDPAVKSDCVNPVDATKALGQKLGVRATPSFFLADGRMVAGAIPKDQLESRLNAAQTKVAAK